MKFERWIQTVFDKYLHSKRDIQGSLRSAYRHLYEGISSASGYEIITGNK